MEEKKKSVHMFWLIWVGPQSAYFVGLARCKMCVSQWDGESVAAEMVWRKCELNEWMWSKDLNLMTFWLFALLFSFRI